ncbi:MAG: ATP-dependent helicase, partial [Actinobacteria bacterium]|nr:ATP-dependent helicase [Actinomycetota bacterium]
MSAFDPSPEQRAILDDPGPQLVLAGAGVGKTAVLTERIVRTIVEQQVAPEHILALTFTRAAAQEMRGRIAHELEARAPLANPNALWAGTYHSFAGDLLREFGVRIGVAPAARLLTEAGQWALLHRIFNDLPFAAVPMRHAPTAFRQILGFVSDAQNHLISPDAIDALVESLEAGATGPQIQALRGQWAELGLAYRAYQEAKLQAGALDFGDQIAYAVALLERHGDVAAEVRRRFPHVYVDEYQDTNSAQRRLLLNLIGAGTPRLFVIGDDDQAIFRFQGATVRNILGLPDESELSAAKPTVRTLVLNRRSVPPILDLANPIADKIRQRRPKDLRHFREGRAEIGAYVADTDRDEARWIAQRIQAMQREAPATGELAAWGSYAVLCRQREFADLAAWALAERSIPFRRAAPVPLLERWEIDEVRATLEVIGTPENDVALARVLAAARWRIGDADLWALARWRLARRVGAAPGADDESDRAFGDALLDALMSVDEIEGLAETGRARLTALRDELVAVSALARGCAVPELVAQVIERGGYARELAAGVHPDDGEALRNLARLQRLAAGFAEADGLPGLRAFLQFLSQADEAEDRVLGEGERPTPDAHAVWITTVHRAKGLEWPVVFIPGLAAGRFAPRGADDADAANAAPYPLKAARAGLPALAVDAFASDEAFERARAERQRELADLEEDDERRLFYVAVTRARERVHLSRAHWYGSRKTTAEASPFWDEALATGLCADLGTCTPSPANPNIASRPLVPAAPPANPLLAEAA